MLSVGPGRVLDSGTRAQLDIKVGDTVLFAKYGGTEFKLEDEDLLILTERDILAVIENGELIGGASVCVRTVTDAARRPPMAAEPIVPNRNEKS